MSYHKSTYTTPMWVEGIERATGIRADDWEDALLKSKEMCRAAEARAELAEAELRTTAARHREELAKVWDDGFRAGTCGIHCADHPNAAANPWIK